MPAPTDDYELLVPFALRDGELTHISAVTDGTRQGYSCPKCQERVVPHLCTKKRRHFAHYKPGSNCVGGLESALHLAAKQVLQRHEAIMVPDVVVQAQGRTLTVSKAQYVRYSAARTEKRLGGTRPDVALIRPSKSAPLLVEVYVSHAVDGQKKAKLAKMGYPCLEVDVIGAFRSDSYDEQELERILVHSDDSRLKRWVCIPDEERYVAILENRIREDEAEESRQKEAAEAVRRRLLEQSLADVRRRNARIGQRRQARGGVLPSKHNAHVNIEVAHEMVFSCDRETWQRTLFRQFIVRPYAEYDHLPGAPVDVCEVEAWLHRRRESLLDPDYNLDAQPSDHFVGLAASEYFDALEQMGLLRVIVRRPDMAYHTIYEVLRDDISPAADEDA